MREAQIDPAHGDAAPAAPPAAGTAAGPRAATAAATATEFTTAGGVRVRRLEAPFDPAQLADITRQVDGRRGGVLSSGMEYPGRYSRWHVGYVDPCIEIVARGRRISARALNQRGSVLLPVIAAALRRAADQAGAGQPSAGQAGLQPGDSPAAGNLAEASQAASGSAGAAGPDLIEVTIPDRGGSFTEEERSRRPTVFSAVREVIAAFAAPDSHLGLYGAFGYDLAFQFEPVRLRP